jgi:hypothetical protein
LLVLTFHAAAKEDVEAQRRLPRSWARWAASSLRSELRRVWLENRGSIMVSRETLEKIMAVMKRHLTPSQVRVIVGELNEVPGDKGFRDTVRAMVAALEREEQQ